ncbi:MAG: hypothetical protein H0W29_10275 [Gemmatimonadales bacterium]|nr:hypothetical protein [Gemmatimonadales bacterium]
MNEQADFVRAWMGELRSGKHRQVFGAFADDTGAVCAMGVLDRVFDTRAPVPRGVVLVPYGLLDAVVDWNDGDRLGFEEIADRIEAWAVRAGIFDIPAALAQADAEVGLNAGLDALQAVGV